MTALSEVTLPPWCSAGRLGIELPHVDVEKYVDFEIDALRDGPRHRSLGHPDAAQGDMPLECQLVTNGLYCGDRSGYESSRAASLAPGAADWRLLLQVDSDEVLGTTWGDGGRIYFWIREDDLRLCRFDNVWSVLQCY